MHPAYSEAQLSGPYTHDNLSIFLIHQSNARTAPVQANGGSRASKVQYLPLQPAMEQKKVVVYETKQVNELAIENLSAESVFIQQGDIVKRRTTRQDDIQRFHSPPEVWTATARCVLRRAGPLEPARERIDDGFQWVNGVRRGWV